MVIAQLRAWFGRHPDDHRPFAHAAQLLEDDKGVRQRTTTRAGKCRMSERTAGLTSGGIGAMQLVAQSTGLVTAIDQHVQVLKVHLPITNRITCWALRTTCCAAGPVCR